MTTFVGACTWGKRVGIPWMAKTDRRQRHLESSAGQIGHVRLRLLLAAQPKMLSRQLNT